MEDFLRLSNEVIHQFYFIMAGGIALLLLRGLFARKTRRSIVYDIVYAYTLIPFQIGRAHV